MRQMRAQHSFALETHFLGNSLGCVVVRVRNELEPLEAEVFESVLREKPQRPRRHTTTSSFPGAPVADVTCARAVDAHPDRPDNASSLGDGELLRADPRDLSLDEGARVFIGVGARNRGNPMMDLGVVARADDRRNVVQRPGTQCDVAVVEFHSFQA